MKNIIIGGTCRSGKSLLAKALNKKLQNHNYFSIDEIRNTLIDTFHKDYKKTFVDELQDFTYNFYCNYKKTGFYSIFEGIYVTKKEVLEKYNTNDNLIIFVGRPSLSPNQLFQDIRNKEKSHFSWTSQRTDDELMQMTINYHNEDVQNLEFCKQYGFLFLDTSFKQIETIEKQADEIVKILNKKD